MSRFLQSSKGTVEYGTVQWGRGMVGLPVLVRGLHLIWGTKRVLNDRKVNSGALTICEKDGSFLQMISSLQYRTLTNCMYLFSLPIKLPVMIGPVLC